jgi:succinate dehydrogenase/fumarate reductase flavoprotein subunit
VDREAIKKLLNITEEFFANRNIDIADKPLLVSTFAHAFNGGVKVDIDGESDIPGLYAIGESATGPHGADRLGGNMIVACQVFGKIAGELGARRAKENNLKNVIGKATDVEGRKIIEGACRPLRPDGIFSPGELLEVLQRTMWKNALVVRNRRSLQRCLKVIDELSAKYSEKLRIDNAGEIVQALGLRNLLNVGQLVTKAALVREESRGSHYRSDFETLDDNMWRKNILLTRENGNVKTTFISLHSDA